MTAPAKLGRYVFKVSVRVKSPFLFGSLDSSTVGMDAQCLTNADGDPILPADHLKGLLVHAFGILQSRSVKVVNGISAEGLFGAQSQAEVGQKVDSAALGDAYFPRTGRLIFSDLVASEYHHGNPAESVRFSDWRKNPASERANTRIKIDADTGTVKDGMLQVIDLAAPLGALVDFTGEIVFWSTEAEAKCTGRALQNALCLIPWFGALRSIGFGEHISENSKIIDPTIERANIDKTIERALPSSSFQAIERFELDGQFDRPFLVDSQRLGGNFFIGADIIPGAVVKGALADALTRHGHNPRSGTLEAVLTALRISHGFPVEPETGVLYERALPLAVKAYQDEFGVTRSDAQEDGLLNGFCADFQNDWKPATRAALRKRLCRPETVIAKLPRGHTAINPQTGVAEEAKLFIEVARDHRCWFRFVFDFGKMVTTHAQEVGFILKALQDGLDGVGKTRATLRFENQSTHAAPSKALNGDHVTLMLETPAALLDPDGIGAPIENGRPLPAFKQLEYYFQKVLPGATLVNAYLALKRVGGFPVQRRRGHGRTEYYPCTMFLPGCCFVLKDADKARLEELARSGLPAMCWDNGTLVAMNDWKTFPWLPAAGYGEISIASDALAFTGSAPR